MLGASVGNYQVVAQIGSGGMGAVYRAQHSMLGRLAAVKVLLPELSQNREQVQRFFNEARAATAIRHPGIVEIYDFGVLADGSAYIIMELLEGQNLGRRLQEQGPPALDQALVLTRQIAGALQAAHERQIVHRDLKPDNVFIVKDPEVPGGERIKLLDFGIAKLAMDGESAEAAAATEKKLGTRTGTVMGTPAYMSPEQCRGAGPGRIDARTDLYSLGCILYQLLCGRLPFIAEGDGDVIAHHLYFPPDPPHRLNPGIPKELEALVLRLLHKEPSGRPQSAAQLIEEIDALKASGALAGSGGLVPPKAGDASSAPSLETVNLAGPENGSATTLNGAVAAGNTVSVRRAGGRIAVAAGAVVLAGVAAVTVWALRGDGAPDKPAEAASPTSAALLPTAATTSAANEPAAKQMLDAAPAAAKTVFLQLLIRPSDAPYQIRVAGSPIDKPEIELPMSRSERVSIEVSAKGYQPYRQEWLPTSDQALTIELEPEKRAGARSSTNSSDKATNPDKLPGRAPGKRVDRVDQL